jgi:hypothetical protein
MRVLPLDAALRAAKEIGCPLNELDLQAGIDEAAAGRGFYRTIPTHSSGILFSRALLRIVAPIDEAVVFIRDVRIWPSTDDFHLFDRFCTSLGAHVERVWEHGLHLSADEKQDLASIVGMILQFGWNAVLVCGPHATKVILSHDGWIWIDPAARGAIMRARLEEYWPAEVDGEGSADKPH